VTRDEKRDKHEAQAFAFLVGWLPALFVGLYLGSSGHVAGIGLAIVGGIAIFSDLAPLLLAVWAASGERRLRWTEAPERRKPRTNGAFLQSGRRDLNSGPLVPQTSALTRLRHAPSGSQSSRPPG
jgi:hypothetical protein